MWILVAAALAVPPPGDSPPADKPPTDTPPEAAAEAPVIDGIPLRACDGAQRCDGRCIPWSAPCTSALRETVGTMTKADVESSRSAELCAAALQEPRKPPDPGAVAALAIAAGVVAGLSGDPVPFYDQRREVDGTGAASRTTPEGIPPVGPCGGPTLSRPTASDPAVFAPDGPKP